MPGNGIFLCSLNNLLSVRLRNVELAWQLTKKICKQTAPKRVNTNKKSHGSKVFVFLALKECILILSIVEAIILIMTNGNQCHNYISGAEICK